MALLETLERLVGPRLDELLKRPSPTMSGVSRGARPWLLGLLIPRLQGPVLWTLPGREVAEKLLEDAALFRLAPGGDRPLLLFPEPEDPRFEAGTADPARLQVLQHLQQGDPAVILAPLRGILTRTLRPDRLAHEARHLRLGDSVDTDELHQYLVSAGYQRTAMVERRGEFSQRGGILDIYSATGEPCRIELFGDTIDSIRTFNLDTQRSVDKKDRIDLLPMREDATEAWLTEYFPDRAWMVVDEPAVQKLNAVEWMETDGDEGWLHLQAQEKRFRRLAIASWGADTGDFDLGTEPCPSYGSSMENLMADVKARQQRGEAIAIISQQATRLRELLSGEGVPILTEPPGRLREGDVWIEHGAENEGFILKDRLTVVCITDRELVGTTRRRRAVGPGERSTRTQLEDLKPGDYVVHVQHGIGQFRGVEQRTVEGRRRDLVRLDYAKGDGLYLPVEQMDLIQKYLGADANAVPTLSRLGGQDWTRTRRKAKESAQAIARELIKLYAERQSRPGYAFAPDTHWQGEMEAAFPFEETADQQNAIDETKVDMETARPMDRLVCGDAGFGKTEVALRAAFKAVMGGQQVGVLVPTTILAQQHYQTFKERLAAFPVKIDVLSRFRTAKEQRDVLEAVEAGTVDIVVGTHRLLQKDVKFKNLGLVVVDEEQHFGVVHKEKLRELTQTVDTLTLTATPIPRTLHMALSGIRDLSVIKTPPEDRLPIKTYLLERSEEVLAGAIIRELQREGQVYVLFNRVRGIQKMAADVRRLVPKARVAVGHGQMHEDDLERVMMDFLQGQYDVLVCTTIIESGLDISNANTIIIQDAQNFGLAQLYQIRGRVGRGHRQAYAYLLYPPHRSLTEVAEQRLETIREFTQVGSGFQIAMRDLEFRGAGNLLGAEQSGFIADVGFDLYMQLLSEAVEELKGRPAPVPRSAGPVLDLPLDAFLPADYVQNHRQKVTLYKRLAEVRTREEALAIEEEMRDRYGPIPVPAANLVRVVEVKLLAMQVGAPSIKFMGNTALVPVPFIGALDRRQLGEVFRASGITAVYKDHQLILVELLSHADWVQRLIAAITRTVAFARS
ncbi:MAG TPA: transcription-repair coupling factor [Candidatus Xenobia bacterium]|jgi:transcription-repair coupling factor (superfamily II helicase)